MDASERAYIERWERSLTTLSKIVVTPFYLRHSRLRKLRGLIWVVTGR